MNATDLISRQSYDNLRNYAENKIPYDFNKTIKQGKAKFSVRMYSYVERSISSIEYRNGDSISGGNIKNVLECSYDEFCSSINELLKKVGMLTDEAEQLCLW